MLKRPLCLAVCIYIAFLVGMRWVSEKDVPDLQAQNTVTILCQLDEIRGMGEKKNFVVSSVVADGKKVCNKLRVFPNDSLKWDQTMEIGNILELTGDLQPPEPAGNPGQFDEVSYYESQGISGKLYCRKLSVKDHKKYLIPQTLYKIRQSLCTQIESILPAQTAGVLWAMLLAEKSGLDDTVKELYTKGGIGHILAISGLHISLIGAGLFFFFRKYIMPMRAAAVLVIFLLLLYGQLTVFSISTARAVTMMILMLTARILGERYDTLNALACAALLELFSHPEALFQASFLLSYGTILGIIFFIREWNDQNITEHKLRGLFVSNLGMMLLTLPVVLYFYYEFNLFSFVANTIVLPCMSLVMALGIGGSLLSYAFTFLAGYMLGAAHYILLYFQWICEWIQKIPGAMYVTGQPSMVQILTYYGGLILFLIFARVKRIKRFRYCFIMFSVLILLWPFKQEKGLIITCLDVGQGDCTMIQCEDHTFMIDGGSTSVSQTGKKRISPWLKFKGIKKIDAIFITHSDEDHISGILELLEAEDHMGIQIGKVVLPAVNKTDESYCRLENKVRLSKIPYMKMEKGDTIHLKPDFTLDCIHPYRTYDWEDANDYSLVLQLTYKNFRGVFMGDLGEKGEKEILSALRPVTFLKTGHHGSKNSSSEEFLDKIRPETASISAGRNNRYHHPHAETLKRLEKYGTIIKRTDECGAITVKSSGNNTDIRVYLE